MKAKSGQGGQVGPGAPGSAAPDYLLSDKPNHTIPNVRENILYHTIPFQTILYLLSDKPYYNIPYHPDPTAYISSNKPTALQTTGLKLNCQLHNFTLYCTEFGTNVHLKAVCYTTWFYCKSAVQFTVHSPLPSW